MPFIYDINDLAKQVEEPTTIDLNQQIEIAKIERLENIAFQLERIADWQRKGRGF